MQGQLRRQAACGQIAALRRVGLAESAHTLMKMLRQLQQIVVSAVSLALPPHQVRHAGLQRPREATEGMHHTSGVPQDQSALFPRRLVLRRHPREAPREVRPVGGLARSAHTTIKVQRQGCLLVWFVTHHGQEAEATRRSHLLDLQCLQTATARTTVRRVPCHRLRLWSDQLHRQEVRPEAECQDSNGHSPLHN